MTALKTVKFLKNSALIIYILTFFLLLGKNVKPYGVKPFGASFLVFMEPAVLKLFLIEQNLQTL